MEEFLNLLTEGRIDNLGLQTIRAYLEQNKQLKDAFAYSGDISYGRNTIIVYSKDDIIEKLAQATSKARMLDKKLIAINELFNGKRKVSKKAFDKIMYDF